MDAGEVDAGQPGTSVALGRGSSLGGAGVWSKTGYWSWKDHEVEERDRLRRGR